MNKRFGAFKVSAAVACVAAMTALTGCGGSSDNTLEKIKDEGTVTVGIAGEAPYSFLENGELKGGTVAIARQVFENLGVENVKAELVDWNSLIPGLNAGRFDMVSAGMSILPERCEQAAFSDPTIMYTTSLMVQEGNPKGLTDMKSIADAGGDVKTAVLAGGIEAGYADSLGIKDVQSVPDAQTGMDTVANGRADVFAMTAISLNWMADKNPDAKIEVTKPFTAVIDGVEQIGSGGAVFRKDDNDLREAFNEELAKITADDASYTDVLGEYGFTAENRAPEGLTTEKLCSGDIE